MDIFDPVENSNGLFYPRKGPVNININLHKDCLDLMTAQGSVDKNTSGWFLYNTALYLMLREFQTYVGLNVWLCSHSAKDGIYLILTKTDLKNESKR